ncbi:MAG: DUF5640 domain-containing protein [Gemmataceae bacterium]|nr:DUF5640 domain-containing protein [Gemmataceae bacterium]
MSRLAVVAAASLVLWAVMPCPIPGQASAPAAKLIVGKWQPLDIKDEATLEFLKDGKVQITAKEVTIPGTYKFTDDTTMEVTLTFGGKDTTLKFKVTVTDDSLTTQEIGKDRTERFKRMK